MSDLRRPTIKSLTVTMHQDLFNEVALLIPPIAKSLALTTKIDDQTITQKIPLLGDKVVANASNLKIEEFEMKKLDLKIGEGLLKVYVDAVAVKVSMDVKALAAHLGRVIVNIVLKLSAIVKLTSGTNGVLNISVEDVVPTATNFNISIGHGVGGDVLESIADLFASTIKSAVASAVAQPIDDALTQGLSNVLGTPLDVTGQIYTVGYKFMIGFLNEPVISEKSGVLLEIGVDTNIKEGLPASAS